VYLATVRAEEHYLAALMARQIETGPALTIYARERNAQAYYELILAQTLDLLDDQKKDMVKHFRHMRVMLADLAAVGLRQVSTARKKDVHTL